MRQEILSPLLKSQMIALTLTILMISWLQRTYLHEKEEFFINNFTNSWRVDDSRGAPNERIDNAM